LEDFFSFSREKLLQEEKTLDQGGLLEDLLGFSLLLLGDALDQA
jgi:hypothetical protein